MRLALTYDESDPTIDRGLDIVRNRLYVPRSLIPHEYEAYFQETAQYLSAHASTAIEGNPLDEAQAMRVLVEGPDPSKPQEVEKVNLDLAYKLMAQLASDQALQIDEGIIRTINSIVLKDLPDAQARQRGRYRPGPSLVVDAVSREVRYRPPPPSRLPELMRGLVEDVTAWREKLAGPVTAALAHFGLISIHPFEDGNGRTARLIADMVLNLTGSSADGMISISQVIHQQLGDYYRVLREVQGLDFMEEVDVTEFVRFHTEAIITAASLLEEKAVRFRRLHDGMLQMMRGILNPRQVTGLMFMVDIGQLSSSRYARLTESSQATALADLTSLLAGGLVVRRGAGKNTRYRLSPGVLEALKDAGETAGSDEIGHTR
jgi:Fic family protein